LFSGGMYEKIGFAKTNDIKPDYSYTKSSYLKAKSAFQHSSMRVMKDFNYDPNLTEKENCMNNGWFRLWDCGKKKWELEI